MFWLKYREFFSVNGYVFVSTKSKPSGSGKRKRVIIIADINKWDTISQIERIKYSMPSTTNALESSHGHLNGQLPRRNNFWSAMLRLVTFILKKESSFSG